MNQRVDARGEACPIPVVKTKKAIRELRSKGGSVTTLVDNEIAVQNLTKMAQQKAYPVTSEKLGDRNYQVTMTIAAMPGREEESAVSSSPAEDCQPCRPNQGKKGSLVVISSDHMGQGDDTLGSILMKGFVYALSQQEELPETILFYNGGARLTCQGAPALEDLKNLEAEGVEILTCGTCLNHYGLTDQLQVGGVTNMYSIVEKMTQASKIIKP